MHACMYSVMHEYDKHPPVVAHTDTQPNTNQEQREHKYKQLFLDI